MPGILKTYATRDLENEASIGAWRDYLNEVYYPHDIRVLDKDFISGALQKRSCGELGVSRHYATPHTIARTSSLIESDKIEQYAFVFPLSGVFNCRQRGRDALVTAGQMYILNASEPFEVDTYNQASSVIATLPSDICRLAVKAIDDKCCRAEVGERVFVETLTGFIKSIIQNGTNADALWLRDICCDLLDAMVNPQNNPDEGAVWGSSTASHRLLLSAIERAIERHLSEPDFSVKDVAVACRVSVRHLQIVLKSAGTTFSDTLTEARLQHAARLLKSPSRKFKSIGQIASNCGFRSQAHFSTSYKQRFGVTPREETVLQGALVDSIR